MLHSVWGRFRFIFSCCLSLTLPPSLTACLPRTLPVSLPPFLPLPYPSLSILFIFSLFIYVFYRIRAYRTLQLLLLLLHVATGWPKQGRGGEGEGGHANAGVYGLLSLLPIGSRKSENCQAIFNLICGAAKPHRVHRALQLILNKKLQIQLLLYHVVPLNAFYAFISATTYSLQPNWHTLYTSNCSQTAS